jgi:hypothetical protein
MKEMPQNQKDRAEWYDRNAELPEREESKVKIAPKAKGQLADGFSKLSMPVQSEKDFHAQTKSERNSVGSRFTVGQQLHGKASPSSEESFVKPKASKESNAR